MDKQCENKEVIRASLAGNEKALVCYVWNGEHAIPSVALIKGIGRSSGHYLDSRYRSWVYAKPVRSADCFFIDLGL